MFIVDISCFAPINSICIDAVIVVLQSLLAFMDFGEMNIVNSSLQVISETEVSTLK